MKYDSKYEIINKHGDKFWYYTVREQVRNRKRCIIIKLRKELAIKFAKESPINNKRGGLC